MLTHGKDSLMIYLTCIKYLKGAKFAIKDSVYLPIIYPLLLPSWGGSLASTGALGEVAAIPLGGGGAGPAHVAGLDHPFSLGVAGGVQVVGDSPSPSSDVGEDGGGPSDVGAAGSLGGGAAGSSLGGIVAGSSVGGVVVAAGGAGAPSSSTTGARWAPDPSCLELRIVYNKKYFYSKILHCFDLILINFLEIFIRIFKPDA